MKGLAWKTHSPLGKLNLTQEARFCKDRMTLPEAPGWAWGCGGSGEPVPTSNKEARKEIIALYSGPCSRGPALPERRGQWVSILSLLIGPRFCKK